MSAMGQMEAAQFRTSEDEELVRCSQLESFVNVFGIVARRKNNDWSQDQKQERPGDMRDASRDRNVSEAEGCRP